MTSREIWLPEDDEWSQIPGYPGYEVSTSGRVYGPGRGRRWSAGLLHPYHTKHGHLYVDMTDEYGVQRRHYVHRLVAEAFIPNPHNLPIVRHLNDYPDDNRVENLEWGTTKDNWNDMRRNGKAYIPESEVIHRANLARMRPVVCVDVRTGAILRFESQCEAARQLGYSQGTIFKMIRRTKNTGHKRYVNSSPYDIYYEDEYGGDF